MNLDALLRVFYLDVYEFEVYDPFSRPQTRILRGIAVMTYKKLSNIHVIGSLNYNTYKIIAHIHFNFHAKNEF